ncbi:MAG: DinB family protein [Blastocatellia bacterium]
MNKQALSGQREYFKMIHGVTLRLIGTFTDADLDYRPQPTMRSVRDLCLHMYGMEKGWAANIRKPVLEAAEENKCIPETEEGKAEAAKLKTVADVLAFAREGHQALDEAAAAITDEELAGNVQTPFGSFARGQMFGFAYDEHWHHRGQLYTYARLMGKDVPMLYDYENSPA